MIGKGVDRGQQCLAGEGRIGMNDKIVTIFEGQTVANIVETCRQRTDAVAFLDPKIGNASERWCY